MPLKHASESLASSSSSQDPPSFRACHLSSLFSNHLFPPAQISFSTWTDAESLCPPNPLSPVLAACYPSHSSLVLSILSVRSELRGLFLTSKLRLDVLPLFFHGTLCLFLPLHLSHCMAICFLLVLYLFSLYFM